MLVAEELCQLGHAPQFEDDITLAHEALVELDARHSADGAWTLDADEHARLCAALDVSSAEQLEVADARAHRSGRSAHGHAIARRGEHAFGHRAGGTGLSAG